MRFKCNSFHSKKTKVTLKINKYIILCEGNNRKKMHQELPLRKGTRQKYYFINVGLHSGYLKMIELKKLYYIIYYIFKKKYIYIYSENEPVV